MTSAEDGRLHRRGVLLERVTLAWNVVGVVVLAIAAVRARSVALAGFGLDSLVEIGASTVVLWELSGEGDLRQRRALRLIGYAFIALAVYIAVQSTVVLVTGFHPKHSPLGIAWTALTAIVMFTLAAGKTRTGAALDNPVLQTEGRVTFIDGLLAVSVLVGTDAQLRRRCMVGRPARRVRHRLLRTQRSQRRSSAATDRTDVRRALGEGQPIDVVEVVVDHCLLPEREAELRDDVLRGFVGRVDHREEFPVERLGREREHRAPGLGRVPAPGASGTRR